MSKLLDPRLVEYAYVQRVDVNYNQAGGTADAKTYSHSVNIVYDLRDASKVALGTKSSSHKTENTTVMDNMETANTKISAVLPAWVLADKLALSGYVPA